MWTVLYSASSSLRPKQYQDSDKSSDRAGVYGLFMLLFIGVVIGLAIYQDKNRTSIQTKVVSPSFPKVQDLQNQYDNNQIQNLVCDCNKPYNNLPPLLNVSESATCKENIHQNFTDYAVLCDQLDYQVDGLYLQTALPAVALLERSDFENAIFQAYLQQCGVTVFNNLQQAQALAIYFKNIGIQNYSEFNISAVGFWEIILSAVNDGDNVQCAPDVDSITNSVNEDPHNYFGLATDCKPGKTLNVTNFYTDYFCNCHTTQCTYSTLQTNFDVFLAVISYLGTIFAVLFSLAAIVYGCLHAQVAELEDKKKRRRKRAKAVEEAEHQLHLQHVETDADDIPDEIEVPIQDDVLSLEVEGGKDEGKNAAHPSKCFVTSCKLTPANDLTMFCQLHGEISKPDEYFIKKKEEEDRKKKEAEDKRKKEEEEKKSKEAEKKNNKGKK